MFDEFYYYYYILSEITFFLNFLVYSDITMIPLGIFPFLVNISKIIFCFLQLYMMLALKDYRYFFFPFVFSFQGFLVFWIVCFLPIFNIDIFPTVFSFAFLLNCLIGFLHFFTFLFFSFFSFPYYFTLIFIFDSYSLCRV